MFGPFCFAHLVVKNAILSQFMVLLTGISVVKYVYIFVVKNPSGHNDDFICFFSNLSCLVNALVYQFVLHFIPGFKVLQKLPKFYKYDLRLWSIQFVRHLFFMP